MPLSTRDFVQDVSQLTSSRVELIDDLVGVLRDVTIVRCGFVLIPVGELRVVLVEHEGYAVVPDAVDVSNMTRVLKG